VTTRAKPLIGITMGDPLGIGPEIILKALRDDTTVGACAPFAIGDAAILGRAAAHVDGVSEIHPIAAPRDAICGGGTVSVLDLANARDIDLAHREPLAASGRAAGEAIERAAELALAGEIDAIVTAPISKQAMRLAGYAHTGHTEMLAHLTGAPYSAMLLLWQNMRVAHVTTHLALRAVPDAITSQLVLRTIELTEATLRLLIISTPRLAVAGLNPHAGEAGLFGEEERSVIAPAVEDARAAGLDVTGPVPPDVVFAQMRSGLYDAVVAMYHDQGHIAIKTLSFTPAAQGREASVAGVNVTMGLPIIRTSVDHGTAFDIAGRGIASEQSMKDAIVLAARMARAGGRR
jgi:4-hydroxythreonine-4-phosphate dehydrogenase